MEPSPLNTAVTHLPANIQVTLTEIVAIIRARCPDSVMIWLFGSYARGDYINGRSRTSLCYQTAPAHPCAMTAVSIPIHS